MPHMKMANPQLTPQCLCGCRVGRHCSGSAGQLDHQNITVRLVSTAALTPWWRVAVDSAVVHRFRLGVASRTRRKRRSFHCSAASGSGSMATRPSPSCSITCTSSCSSTMLTHHGSTGRNSDCTNSGVLTPRCAEVGAIQPIFGSMTLAAGSRRRAPEGRAIKVTWPLPAVWTQQGRSTWAAQSPTRVSPWHGGTTSLATCWRPTLPSSTCTASGRFSRAPGRRL
mmetsp:Transcript_35118/g.92370  ORF Transcript_35118/g.92370 Transcript_35118/m.92370 type:complete len:225 (+) Transcript_35118:215-889(+)